MNWESIIQTILTATIPALLTYFATKKSNDAKINEITITKDSEIKQLKLAHKHEIEKLESEHKHSIEKLEIEHKLHKDIKSDDMSTELTLKLLSGELNLPNLLTNLSQLEELQNQVDKLNSKKEMSKFVKKK